MANILLKNYSGDDVTYEDVQAVLFKTSDGGTQIYSKGEALENVSVTLDLSDGDQTVNAPEGYLVKSAVIAKPSALQPENIKNGVKVAGVEGSFVGDTEEVTVDLAMASGNQIVTPSASGKVLSQVTITKPETLIPANIAKDVNIGGIVGTLAAETEEKTVNLDFSGGDMAVMPSEGKSFSKVNILIPNTLVPENIAEGVDIAGIIGTLAAGGGGVKFKIGNAKGRGEVTHGLGVLPDLIVLFTSVAMTGYIISGVSFSRKFNAAQTLPSAISTLYGGYYLYYNGSNSSYKYTSYCLDDSYTEANQIVHSANTEKFNVGSNSYNIDTLFGINWLAIGGLV